MGQRTKAKNNPAPIYRSRQAGRTDIEELLRPAFDPHQRLTADTIKATSLPDTHNELHQREQSPYDMCTGNSLPTVDTALGAALPFGENEQQQSPKFSQQTSLSDDIIATKTFSFAVPSDPVDIEINSILEPSLTIENKADDLPPTVDIEPLTTVGIDSGLSLSTIPLDTVDSGLAGLQLESFDKGHLSFERHSLSTIPGDPGYQLQWRTEQGQIVSEKQVRPFKIAQEVLNSNERVLYTVLWNHKEAKVDFQDPHIRTVRAGYDLLAKQTNLAKKTIQRLIPRLMQKDFIRLNETPDFYNRVATSYQVLSYKRVLEIAAERGRTHVAKLGHGIAFVRRYSQVPSPEVDKSPGTVVNDPLPTVVPKSTVSVPHDPLSTVVRKSTLLETRTVRKEETTTAPPELFNRLETLVPGIDTRAVERIWREGREVVADIQPEEVAFWFEQRARLVYQNRGLNNPLGLLLSSIRDWLTERKIMTRRNQLRELAEEELRIRQQWEEEKHHWREKGGHDVG